MESDIKKFHFDPTNPIKISEWNFYGNPSSDSPFSLSYYGGHLIRQYKRNDGKFTIHSNSGSISVPMFNIKVYKNIINFCGLIDGTILYLFEDGTIQIRTPTNQILFDYPGLNESIITASYHTHEYIVFTDSRSIFCYNFNTNELNSITSFCDFEIKFIIPIDINSNRYIVASSKDLYLIQEYSTPILLRQYKDTIINTIPNFESTNYAVITTQNIYFLDSQNSGCNVLSLPKNSQFFAWISESIFVIGTDHQIITIENYQISKIIDVGTICTLFRDIDCVRIYASSGFYVMMKEPNEITKALSGNISSYLYKSYFYHEQADIKAYYEIEYTNHRDNAYEHSNAVNDLLRAGLASITIENQEQLLKLAAYAKTLAITGNAREFSETIEQLQMRNTLNNPNIGFFLTDQMFQLSKEYIVQRMNNLRMYSFATQICKYFGVSESEIAEKWAMDEILLHKGSNLDVVIEKLRKYNDIRYELIAEIAFTAKLLPNDITKLIREIPFPQQRVNLLLRIDPKLAEEECKTTKDGAAILAFMMSREKSARLQLMSNDRIFADQMLASFRYSFESNVEAEVKDPMFSMLSPKKRGEPKPAFTSPLLTDEAVLTEMGSEGYGKRTVPLAFANSAFSSKNVVFELQYELNKITKNMTYENQNAPTMSPRQCLEEAYARNDNTAAAEIAAKFGFTREVAAKIKARTFIRRRNLEKLDAMTRTLDGGLTWLFLASECAEEGLMDEAVRYLKRAEGDGRWQVVRRFGLWDVGAQMAAAAGKTELMQEFSRYCRTTTK